MPNKCKCGGHLHSEYSNRKFFVWRCDRCGRRIYQHKRQKAQA